MANQIGVQDSQRSPSGVPLVSVTSTEGITALHSSAQAPASSPSQVEGVGECLMQDLLPEISAVARKVGGFKKLAELALELDRGNQGK